MDMWYKDSCILIGIPKWSEGQQQLVKLSIAESATEESMKMPDNIEACFQNTGVEVEKNISILLTSGSFNSL